MTSVLYLQTREHGKWVLVANSPVSDDVSEVTETLRQKSNMLDRNWGRRRPWRIVSLAPSPIEYIVHWRSDVAIMWEEAEAKLEKKRLDWRPKAIDAWEMKICQNAIYFTLCSPDGRLVAVPRVDSYAEALRLREDSNKPGGLIYAVAPNGRSALVTDWIGEQLLRSTT